MQPPLNFNTGIEKATFFTSFTYFYTTAHIVQGGTCSVLQKHTKTLTLSASLHRETPKKKKKRKTESD